MSRPCPVTCGLCYANRRGRGNYKGHRGYRASRGVWRIPVVEFLKRVTGEGVKASRGTDVCDEKLKKSCPALCEFLNETEWPDGSAREPGTLLLFMDCGRWKAMVRDRDGGRVAFVTADTTQILFDVIEKGLRGDSLDWRADKAPAKGRRG